MDEFSADFIRKTGIGISDFGEPVRIQEFLDGIPYNSGKDTKTPKRVLEERTAHCFEGALFSAALLRTIGHKPLVVDLRAENDDDHVIAVFREKGCWGASWMKGNG